MTHASSLRLDSAECAELVFQIRRYENYRDRLGQEILDSHLQPEPDDDHSESPNAWVFSAAKNHFSVAEECADLANRLDTRDVVAIGLAEIDLVAEAVNEAYPDEKPPVLARVDEFATLVQHDLSSAKAAGAAEAMLFFVKNDAPLPPSPAIPAPVAAPRVKAEPTMLEQVAQLSEQVAHLTTQVQTQQKQLDALRPRASSGARSRRLAPLMPEPQRRTPPDQRRPSL